MTGVAENLAEFFTDFAVDAVGDDASTRRGILLEPFEASRIGLVPMEAASPVFRCVAADVASLASGDVLTISERLFTIRELQPDGAGLISLILERHRGETVWDGGETEWDEGNTTWS
jgi:hypothetical protein